MKKTTALFQIVTELFLIGLFAICLAPSIFSINVDIWGAKMNLNVKDLLRLSDPVNTFCLVASIALFFVVVLFSLTSKNGKPPTRIIYRMMEPRKTRRKNSQSTSEV